MGNLESPLFTTTALLGCPAAERSSEWAPIPWPGAICPKTVEPASGCAVMAALAPRPGSSAGAGAKDLKEGRAKAPITMAFEGETLMFSITTPDRLGAESGPPPYCT